MPSVCGVVCKCGTSVTTEKGFKQHIARKGGCGTNMMVYSWLHCQLADWHKKTEWTDLQVITDLTQIKLWREGLKESSAMQSTTGFLNVAWKDIKALHADQASTRKWSKNNEEARRVLLAGIKKVRAPWRIPQGQPTDWDSEAEYINAVDRTTADILQSRIVAERN